MLRKLEYILGKWIFEALTCFIPKTYKKHLGSIVKTVSFSHFYKISYDYLFKQPKHFKYNLSMCMCVKDEASYLQEWLEYYILQGVDHFYIYNNNGTDNTPEILAPYINKNLVTYQDFPGLGQQINIYNHAINLYKNETRWLGIVDIDEFIVPLKHKTIAKFLQDYNGFNQILIFWILYGSSGHKIKTDGLVIERFTKHQNGINPNTKAIVNPRAVLHARIHDHLILGKTIDEKKRRNYCLNKDLTTAEIIRINHYVVDYAEVDF